MKEIILTTERIRTKKQEQACFSIPEHIQPIFWHFVKQVEAKSNRYTLRISPAQKPRSTGPKSQCAHLNGHVQQIAEETGHEFDEIKMTAKVNAIKRGLRTITTLDGAVYPISEADMNTEEAGYVIEELHAIAAFLNIRLKEDFND